MLKVLDLFSGAGGFSLGLESTGRYATIGFCEIEPWAQKTIRSHWPTIPLHTDVRELSYARSHSSVRPDLICGGFPCQDASIANTLGEGTRGSRTGLFREIVRIAGETRRPVLLENVPELLARGFGDVLAALAGIGFDAEWDCLAARDAGLNHERQRLFIFGYPRRSRWQGLVENDSLFGRARQALAQRGDPVAGRWPSLVRRKFGVRSDDGLSVAMERRRLRLMGNAVVPALAGAIGTAIADMHEKSGSSDANTERARTR